MTHHLPSKRSVAPEHVGSPLNVYFVHDIEHVLVRREPSLWIHGHAHSSLNYRVGATRVVCNPYGYTEIGENARFDSGMVVDVAVRAKPKPCSP